MLGVSLRSRCLVVVVVGLEAAGAQACESQLVH